MEAQQADMDVEQVAEEIAQIAEGRVIAVGETFDGDGYFAIKTDYAGTCIDRAEFHGYSVYTVNALSDGQAEIRFEQ